MSLRKTHFTPKVLDNTRGMMALYRNMTETWATGMFSLDTNKQLQFLPQVSVLEIQGDYFFGY